MIGNRLITQGFGPSRGEEGLASLITIGAGGVPTFVVETLEQVRATQLRYGGSSARKNVANELALAIAWAKLVGVNGVAGPNIQGSVSLSHEQTYAKVVAELVSTRMKKTTEAVKVYVSRIRRR